MSYVLDQVMAVMEAAFDPVFGEAWNRTQVADSLSLASTHVLLADADGCLLDEDGGGKGAHAAGFAFSRGASDEEELLLIAVDPEHRGRGVGKALMQQFIARARARGANRLFLEMRECNPAIGLYRQFGFQEVGLRRNYYRSGSQGPFNALTMALTAQQTVDTTNVSTTC